MFRTLRFHLQEESCKPRFLYAMFTCIGVKQSSRWEKCLCSIIIPKCTVYKKTQKKSINITVLVDVTSRSFFRSFRKTAKGGDY